MMDRGGGKLGVEMNTKSMAVVSTLIGTRSTPILLIAVAN
jgi:hypothetical protein